MGNLLTYSGIVTKIRAMESKLLKPRQFEELASLRNIHEAFSYLKENTSYGNVLDELKETQIHRTEIEKMLIRQLYADYTRIYRFCSLGQREFLKLYIKQYETDLIDYCFRIVINGYDEPFDLYYKKPFFDRYSDISIEKLITSRTAEELVQNLKGTEYYEPLKRVADLPFPTLFDYDLTLDQFYFSKMWKDREKILKRKELEIYTRDCGTKIDLLNLQWVYRARKYYNMEPADIYALLIPIHYKISTRQMKAVVEAATAEDMIAAIRKTSYARQSDFSKNQSIEQMYADCLQRLYLLDRKQNPYSIATINTYLFLKEEEIKKLTTTLECIRYGLNPAETLAFIGGKVI